MKPLIVLSEEAIKFFNDLAENHPCYPSDPSRVIDSFIREWEIRDKTLKEYRTFK